MTNWKQQFQDFFNHPWQQDTEIYFLEAIKEFKNQMFNNEAAGKEYLGRMLKSNEKAILSGCSERFMIALDELIGDSADSAETDETSNDVSSEETPAEGYDLASEEANVDSIEAEAGAEEAGKEPNKEENKQKNESLMKSKKLLKEMAAEDSSVFIEGLPKLFSTKWTNPKDIELVNAIAVNRENIEKDLEKGFNYIKKMMYANSQFIQNACSKELKNLLLNIVNDKETIEANDFFWEANEPKGSKSTSVKGDFGKFKVSQSKKPKEVKDELDKGGDKVKDAKPEFDNNSEIISKSDAKLPIGDNKELLDLLKEYGASDKMLNEWTMEELNNMRRMNNPGMGVKRKGVEKVTKSPKVKQPKDMSIYIAKWEKQIKELQAEKDEIFSEQDLEAGQMGLESFEAEGKHNEYGGRLNDIDKKIEAIEKKLAKYNPEKYGEVTYEQAKAKLGENYLYFPSKAYCYLVQADNTFNPYSASTYPKMYFNSEETAKQYIDNNTKKGDLKYKGKVNESIDEWSDNENYIGNNVHPENDIEEDVCPVCKKNSSLSGICNYCEKEGWWMDPAGGIHAPDEDDPARMYEAEQPEEFEDSIVNKRYNSDEWVEAQRNAEGIQDEYDEDGNLIQEGAEAWESAPLQEGDGTEEPEAVMPDDTDWDYKPTTLKEGHGDEIFDDEGIDLDWDFDGLNSQANEFPKQKGSAYEKYKASHPELNWAEAEEVSEDDLFAASEHYDRMRQSGETEEHYGHMRESTDLNKAISDLLDE